MNDIVKVLTNEGAETADGFSVNIGFLNEQKQCRLVFYTVEVTPKMDSPRSAVYVSNFSVGTISQQVCLYIIILLFVHSCVMSHSVWHVWCMGVCGCGKTIVQDAEVKRQYENQRFFKKNIKSGTSYKSLFNIVTTETLIRNWYFKVSKCFFSSCGYLTIWKILRLKIKIYLRCFLLWNSVTWNINVIS